MFFFSGHNPYSPIHKTADIFNPLLCAGPSATCSNTLNDLSHLILTPVFDIDVIIPIL